MDDDDDGRIGIRKAPTFPTFINDPLYRMIQLNPHFTVHPKEASYQKKETDELALEKLRCHSVGGAKNSTFRIISGSEYLFGETISSLRNMQCCSLRLHVSSWNILTNESTCYATFRSNLLIFKHWIRSCRHRITYKKYTRRLSKCLIALSHSERALSSPSFLANFLEYP